MKTLIVFILVSITCFSGISQDSGFYTLKSETIDGQEFCFDQLKGKKVMIVNTATKCSLSQQFHALQELYTKFADIGFMVIAIPTNDFGRREPGNNEAIKDACDKRFGITFPIMAKTTTEGPEIHPVFQWLTQKDKNEIRDSEIRWNFQKYLIDEKGVIVEILEPMKKPDGDFTLSWLSK